MRSITEQDVLKAFYRFDCKKLPVFDINGKFTASLDVEMRKRLCAEWMDAFNGLEADVFEKATKIALERCKKYPSMSEMFELIALADGGEIVEEKAPRPVEPSASELRKKRIMAMVAAAKTGDYKTAYEYAANDAAAKEFAEFVKITWPEATAEWIAVNRAEIESLLKQEKQCGKCGSLRRCKTKGYKLGWQIGEQDQLLTVMSPCFMRKAGKDENVQ